MTAGQDLERRRSDRRRTDRRRAPQNTSEDSWFGALADRGLGGDVGRSETLFAGGERPGISDSRFLAREAERIVSEEDSALHRVFRAYVAARAALGAALVVAPWAMALLGTGPPLTVVLVCLAYASQAVSLWLLGGPARDGSASPTRLRRRQWMLTIGVDLLVFSVLHLMDTAQPLNYSALLALPVLMSGVMTKRLAALATAALVSLVLLLGVWRPAALGGDVVRLLSEAAIGGIGAFVIALIAGELSQRLAREERSARGSLEIARQQARLNRLVLEEMADGVLVIDRRSRLRAANRAARSILGLGESAAPMPVALQSDPSWKPLLQAVEQAFSIGRWPEARRELEFGDEGSSRRLVQVRARFARRSDIEDDGQPEDVCVLFLEDMRRVQARVRQEKLASMGRMSAGISHEIRNPLAAIAQANALMLEDAVDPAQLRLARIVEDNVERLKRIVDDVLAVAPSDAVRPQALDAVAQVHQICSEWTQTTGVGGGDAAGRLTVRLPDAKLHVLFDADHLRRVLVNLLDNARRHASETAGAIAVALEADPNRGVALDVASDGAPIAPEVERHLFEPFFSTRSRGTGLGLYICRELCERYDARIEFRPAGPGQRHRNVFRVVMRAAPAA